MDTRDWRNCIEALYYLSITGAIFAFALNHPSAMAWMIALLIMCLGRDAFSRTIGRNLKTVFDERGFKFMEASLFLLLTIALYLGYKDRHDSVQILIAAVPLLGIFYSLLKPEAKGE